jgi:hypothetical protein
MLILEENGFLKSCTVSSPRFDVRVFWLSNKFGSQTLHKMLLLLHFPTAMWQLPQPSQLPKPG